jgi:hypothetical protein
MSISHALLGGAVLFALLQFVGIPWVRWSLRADRGKTGIHKAALLALFSFARGFFLVTTATLGMIQFLVTVAELLGGATNAQLVRSIAAIEVLRQSLLWFEPRWAAGALIVLGVGLAAHAYWSGKRKYQRAFDALLQEEIDRLVATRDNWESLPPTPAMEQVQSAINEVVRVYTELQASNRPESERAAIIPVLEQRFQEYYNLLFRLDVSRRIKLDFDPERVAMPEPVTRWEKLMAVFYSKGLLSCLGRGSRLIYVASLVLFVPCLLGVSGSLVAPRLAERVIKLDDLRIRLSVEQARAERERAESELAAEVPAELSAEDQATIALVARIYESMSGGSDYYRPNEARVAPDFATRSSATRFRVLNRLVEQAEARPDTPAYERPRRSSDGQDFSPPERLVIRAQEDAQEWSRPTTERGRRVEERLTQLAERSASFREGLRAKLSAFQEPAGARSMRAQFGSQLVNLVVSGEGGDYAGLFSAADLEEVRTVVRRVDEARTERFLTKMIRGTALDEALHTLQTENPDHPLMKAAELARVQSVMVGAEEKLPPPTSLDEKLRRTPPTVDVVADATVDLRGATGAIDQIRQRQASRGLSDSEGLADAIAEYRDYFPGQIGAETITPHGRLLSDWEAGPKKASESKSARSNADEHPPGADTDPIVVAQNQTTPSEHPPTNPAERISADFRGPRTCLFRTQVPPVNPAFFPGSEHR